MYMKRFFAFVISAFLIFYPAYAYANTSVGSWTALDTITAGATNTINATKTAGGKVLNSAITIAPQAGKVGKHLIKGGGSAALAFAIVELADGAIDWVLDPANNSVKVTPASVPSDFDGVCPSDGFKVSSSSYGYSTREGACQAQALAKNQIFQEVRPNGYGAYNCIMKTQAGGFDSWGVTQSGVCAAPPVSAPDPYSIPIDTVAAKVISNAEAGHAPSQEAVKATALEGFAAGEHDAALEAGATETGTENPPDTENPPKDPDAPAEPFDPSSIIAAINSLKALLAGILSSITGMADSVTSLFDWTQEEPPEEEAPVPVPYGELGDVGLDGVDRYEERINFAGQCPANDFSFSMLGVTYSKPIPYHYFCGLLEQIAPWLLAMCYLGTAYFVVENV